jgi:hypothetical protein
VLKQTEGNRSATIPWFGSGVADATSYVDRNGQHFPDWPAFFAPVSSHDDSVTRVFTWDVADAVVASVRSDDPDFDLTHFGYNAQAFPRTFDPENIVMLANGDCSSSCTTLSHLLKWQAKVKTVVMGGRPQTGPMQQPGGIKGGTVVGMSTIAKDAELAYSSGILPESLAEKANTTNLVSLVGHSNNLTYRTSDPSDSLALRINLINSVLGNEAENGNPDLWADKEIVPLQMLYEAADCRLFYTAQTVFSRFDQWIAAANQAFGFNGTEAWSGCVEGSFGHETSLSGDELLYNGGVPVNVTGFDLPTVGGGPVDVSQFDIKGNQFIKLVEDGQTPPSTTESGQATETGRPMETSSENSGVRVELCCGVMAAVALVVGFMVVTA